MLFLEHFNSKKEKRISITSLYIQHIDSLIGQKGTYYNKCYAVKNKYLIMKALNVLVYSTIKQHNYLFLS